MIEEIFYDSIDLLQQLISTPSVSRDEVAVASVFEDYARRNMPGEVRRLGNNVLVFSPQFDESKKTILLNSHLDTVKPVSGWSKDPFVPCIEEETERLYGLGSNDAGASLVSLAGAYRYLISKPQNYNLIFVASAEEEVSGKGGIEMVIPSLPAIDFVIVGEPTGMCPAIAEKGLLVLDGVVEGISGHAARNEGVNAIYKALPVVTLLSQMRLPKVSKTLGDVKISVTQINAGTQHNVVPDKCNFVVDVRTTDAYSNEETLDLLCRAVEPLGAILTPRSTRLKPSGISENHPVVSRLKMLGKEPFGSSTLSDQALMPWQSLKLGPGDSARSHTADEFIYMREIREAIYVYIRVLDNL